MSKRYVNITGLWQRDSQRGTILSGGLTPDTLDKLRSVLADPDINVNSQLVVFVNDKKKHDRSPTHNLVVSIDDEPYSGKTGASQSAPPRTPAPAYAAHNANARPSREGDENFDKDPLPF